MCFKKILSLSLMVFVIASISFASDKAASTTAKSAPAKKEAVKKFDCKPLVEKISGLGKRCLAISFIKDRIECWNNVTKEIGDGFKTCNNQLISLQTELAAKEKQLYPKDEPGLK